MAVNHDYWRETRGGGKNSIIENYLFSLETHNGLDILIDPNLESSTIGQLFYYKFKLANNDIVASIIPGNSILCSVKIGGKYYPVTLELIQGTSRPTLGQEFFHQYKWVLVCYEI